MLSLPIDFFSCVRATNRKSEFSLMFQLHPVPPIFLTAKFCRVAALCKLPFKEIGKFQSIKAGIDVVVMLVVKFAGSRCELSGCNQKVCFHIACFALVAPIIQPNEAESCAGFSDAVAWR